LLQLDDGTMFGHRILSTQMMAELHRPEIEVGVNWKPAARAENLHYALGWFTADVRGVHLVYHNGENPGFRAKIVLAPSSKAGVVILTNGEPPHLFTDAATRSLLEQLFPSQSAPSSRPHRSLRRSSRSTSRSLLWGMRTSSRRQG
jgi:hypothetical protein